MWHIKIKTCHPKGNKHWINREQNNGSGTYCGCSIGISKINSGGSSKISGSSPLACKTSGSTSKEPYFGVHPSRIQICKDHPLAYLLTLPTLITENKTAMFNACSKNICLVHADIGTTQFTHISKILHFCAHIHLCEVQTGRVSSYGSVWHLIPSIFYKLAIPNTKVMLSISSLRKHCDRRPTKGACAMLRNRRFQIICREVFQCYLTF